MKPATILAIFAHPDDEVFSCGGSFALLSRQGVQIALACATRGEAGEIASPELATPETLGQVREAELREAAKHMGIQVLHFLGYRNSGMDGAPENDHPNAFMNAPADKVVSQLAGLIRHYQPEIVITFEPGGGYGHPDHLAIHHHTVAAVSAAAFATYRPELGASWRVPRLLYTALARRVLVNIRDALAAQGEVPPILENIDDRPHWSDPARSILMNVSDASDAKLMAFRAHRTQFGANSFLSAMPPELLREAASLEEFMLAPTYENPDRPLTHLLDGLDAAQARNGSNEH